MPRHHRLSSNYAAKCRKEQPGRRLRLEPLERRDCPAVMLDFAEGVLKITGDEGPNAIEIFQPRDRVVEVQADGRQQTFEGVDEVFIDSLGGDDSIRSSKPKEIVVVGSKINVNAGAGDDNVHIDDGGVTRRPLIWNMPLDVAVDLGTGADELVMRTHHHDDLELDLTSGDGGDRILVGMLMPAVQKVREAAARIEMDVSTIGSQIEVRLDNIENVDLSIVSDPSTPEPVAGGTIAVYWHVINNGQSGPTGDLSVVGEIGNGSSIGVSPSSLSFTATAGGAGAPAAANVAFKSGAGDDSVAIKTRNIEGLKVEMETGEGNDSVNVDSRAGVGILKSTDGGRSWIDLGTVTFTLTLGFGDDRAKINTIGYGEVNGHVDAGDGDDTIVSNSSPTPARAVAAAIIAATQDNDFYLGGGNDHLTIETSGNVSTKTFVDAGDGDDTIVNRSRAPSPSTKPLPVLLVLADRQDYFLGDGNDRLAVESSGYHQSDILVDAGDGDDEIRTRVTSVTVVFDTVVTLNVNLGAGNDTLAVDVAGYRNMKMTIDSAPEGDGRDSASVRVDSLKRGGRKQAGRITLDGGADVFEYKSVGYVVQGTNPTPVAVEWVFVA